jgi:Putative peptidoglycan binding domain
MAASTPGESAYYFYQSTRKDGYGYFTEQFKHAHTDPMPDDPGVYGTLWEDVVAKSKTPIDIVARGEGPADNGFYDKDGNYKRQEGKQILQNPIAENNLVYIGKPMTVASAEATRGIAVATPAVEAAVKKLRNGDDGDEVKALKLALIDNGYTSLAKNAEFDDDTEDAVRDFQKKAGLKVDGVAGAETRAMLGI